MINAPSKIASRISAGIKNYQPIISSAKSRDVNESDTVTIVTDMLKDIFGYDKYADVTSEHSIRGTYCDLAIKVDGALVMLVEVKAIGLELKDQFVKQAVDYAANEGIDWVVLTNAAIWRVYRVTFCKPIEHDLVLEISFTDLSHKNQADVDLLWLLAKEGWKKTCLDNYHEQRQVLSRYTFAALILSEQAVNFIRKELKRIAPGMKIEADQISNVLSQDVIKRDAMEGDKAIAAKRLVSRSNKKARKSHAETKEAPDQAQDEKPENTDKDAGGAT